LQNTDIQIKAMLSPTVPQGNERLRITLHRTNTSTEIDHLLETIRNFENIF
jgi:8-amino-7-oxononanoate synthase